MLVHFLPKMGLRKSHRNSAVPGPMAPMCGVADSCSNMYSWFHQEYISSCVLLVSCDHLLGTFSSWTVPASIHSMLQRSRQILRLPRPKKEIQRRSPLYSAFTLWNSLPVDLQKLPSWNSLTNFFTNTI